MATKIEELRERIARIQEELDDVNAALEEDRTHRRNDRNRHE